MKYHHAAVALATAASISSLSSSNALDTTTRKAQDAASETNPISAMFGYCIGCAALIMTHRVESNEMPIKSSSSTSMVENNVETTSPSRSSSSDLPEQCTRPISLFLPFSKNKPDNHNNVPERHSFESVNLHQLNLKSVSKSINNEQPFLQDLLALCLFLIALAVGMAWSDNDVDDEEHDRKRMCTAEHNKFDLISRRLISDNFGQIGLSSTHDDDEEGEQEEQDFKKKKVKKKTPQAKDEPQWTLRYRGEWQPCYVTDNEDEIITEKEEVIILTKPIQNQNAGKVVKKSSILAGSASNTECLSSIRVTKKVSFQENIGHDEEEVTSVSSMTTKRKGLWFKLSLGSLCDLKIRE